MDQVILDMLNQYDNQTDDDYLNALKEIMQQVALLGLWRVKFFEHTAFYGGTALRVLHKLDRFSEDLDFSLLKANDNFDLAGYLDAVATEINAFGFDVSITKKDKSQLSAVQSAFLKANTKEHLISIKAPPVVQERCNGRALLKIKLEIDTDPPLNFSTETLQLISPLPHSVRTYTLPDLFAGKISAVLCRLWDNRVKGRDWYDFLWFVQRNTPVGLIHLETRLRASGYYQSIEPLSLEALKEMLFVRTSSLEIDKAKEDIVKFIKHPNRLDGWSHDIFYRAIEQLRV